METITAQIYRNAIQHHRNQMKFLSYLVRETGLNRLEGLKLMKSHAMEIKEILNNWKLSYPIHKF